MQSGSAVFASVPVPPTSDCRAFTSQSGDNSSEVSPVNLVTYASRVQKSGIDVLYYRSDVTSYSGYSQNSDSPSKSNFPIDLVVSAPQAQSERSELLNSNDPVDLAAYTHKQPDSSAPPDHSVNETSAVSVRSRNDSSQPTDQTVSTDMPGQGTLSTAAEPGTYQNAPAVICSLAAAYSSRPPHTEAYQHGVGLTHTMPSSYYSAQWQPMLSPRTAQLMATAVCNTSGQPLCSENAVKEGDRSPLLLQLQTALLRGFPPTSSPECQSAASLAIRRRQFACNICGKMLSSQHNLRLHEATIHRGLFQFHCPICNKGLRQERDLRGHLANRHDWKKEFRCSICGHEFGYKRNLKHHVMSHHGRTSLDE